MVTILRCLITLASYLAPWYGEEIAFSQTNSTNVNQSYQDDRIQFWIPAHWSYKPVYRASAGSASSKYRIGVVLSDGLFDLYLLTHYDQASGVTGGRFSEVAGYVVPWLKDDEPSFCLDIFKQKINGTSNELVWVDLILDPKYEVQSHDPLSSSIQRSVTRRVWAGAYFGYLRVSSRAPGFFIDTLLGTATDTGGGNQLVFDASVRATAGALLIANDPQLGLFLAEIDRVIAGIKYLKC